MNRRASTLNKMIKESISSLVMKIWIMRTICPFQISLRKKRGSLVIITELALPKLKQQLPLHMQMWPDLANPLSQTTTHWQRSKVSSNRPCSAAFNHSSIVYSQVWLSWWINTMLWTIEWTSARQVSKSKLNAIIKIIGTRITAQLIQTFVLITPQY